MTTQKTFDKNSKNPSLRSLTPQISGVRNWTNKDVKNLQDVGRMELDFDAAYQESKRIRNNLAEFANIKSLSKITEKNAKATAELMKRMHFVGDMRDVYEKIRTKCELQKSDTHRLLIAVNSVLLNCCDTLPEKQRQRLELQLMLAETHEVLEQYSSLLYGDGCNLDFADSIAALNELHRAITSTVNEYQEGQAAYATQKNDPSPVAGKELDQVKKLLRIIWDEDSIQQN